MFAFNYVKEITEDKKMLDEVKYNHVHADPGFIAAMDQGPKSTPATLKKYGYNDAELTDEDQMQDMMHEYRIRMYSNPDFTGKHFLGVILYRGTMDRKVGEKFVPDYLWEDKGIVSFLNIDSGLAEEKDGVKLMNPIPDLDEKLCYARDVRHVFGTKERSFIIHYNEKGIHDVVRQQFEVAKKVNAAGMLPILEPEVSINSDTKEACETALHDEIVKALSEQSEDFRMVLKVTIPCRDNLYADVMKDPHVCRVIALSGGYSKAKANELLAKNDGMVASYSRALIEGLDHSMSDDEFNRVLSESISEIYRASVE